VCAIEGAWQAAGRLTHAIRDVQNNWTAFDDVQAETSKVGRNIGPIAQVACATTLRDDLHVCVIDKNGKLWHTIRWASGEWPEPFGDVQAETSKVGPNRGQLSRIACAINIHEELHVCAVDVNGGLWHTVRMASGRWTAFGDVLSETGKVRPNIGPIFSADCSADHNGELHVCAVNQNGKLWHTIRHEADPTLAGILGRNIDANDRTWDAFGDVLAEASALGPTPEIPLGEIACAARRAWNTDFHICVVTAPWGQKAGQIWNTFRQPDGLWRSFTYIQEVAKILGSALNVCISHD